MERRLQRLSWLEFQRLVPNEIDTVILPVGTVEAHGSACLGVDNFIPETIADGIAEEINALIAPTVNYGITRSLYRYPGGSTITPDTFKLYVAEILASLADHRFRNVILLNGHGGNNATLKAAALEWHHQYPGNIAVIHWWELCADVTKEVYGHAGGHAGTDETAMVIAIDPALADKDSFSPDLAYAFKPGADVYPVPGTILLGEESVGLPDFDVDKARGYREKVCAKVAEFVADVIERWRQSGLA